MDKDQERLIDLAADAYRNHMNGNSITVKGLVASTAVMPVVMQALSRLGPDFHFALVACADWNENAYTYLRNRVAGAQRAEILGVDPDSFVVLGKAYANYRVAPGAPLVVDDATARVVRELVPILTRTLSRMSPAMHLMSEALSGMEKAITPLTNDAPKLENNPVSL